MMKSSESHICQCQCVPTLSLGVIQTQPRSLLSLLKLTLKRKLSDVTKRRLKKNINYFINIARGGNKKPIHLTTQPNIENHPLFAGDIVHVLSEGEIRDTLNAWNELKGCMFMDAQRQYCNTIQKVLKPVERFVDERDYRVKKAKGVVLLEGVLCEGTPDYGRCDRACFYFWREEWLERVEKTT